MAQRLNPTLFLGGFGHSITVLGESFSVGCTTDPALMAIPTGSGNINLNTPGLVMQNYNCTGRTITASANNCVVRNCKFNASGSHTIYQTGSATGLLIENCTFDGEKLNLVGHTDWTYSDQGAMTIQNNIFLNAANDHVNVQGGIVQRNVFVGGGYATGAHTDGFTIHLTTGGPTLVYKNYMDLVTPPDATIPDINAAIKIVAYFGNISNVTVEQNILLGGGYTIYAQIGQPYGFPYTNTNCDIISNYIGLGHWGDLFPTGQPPDLLYSGNQSFVTAPNSIVMYGGGTSPPPPPPPGVSTYIGVLRIG